jgi:addiction module RelE/StbE family toxin
MIIQTTKTFDKQYIRLNEKVKRQFKQRLELFTVEPFEPAMRNHALKGKYLGYRSIEVAGDIRALYTVKGNIVVIFGFIGTHSQLY